MQNSVLTRQSGRIVHLDKVCLTVSCVYTHPVQGLASPRTLDYNTFYIIIPCIHDGGDSGYIYVASTRNTTLRLYLKYQLLTALLVSDVELFRQVLSMYFTICALLARKVDIIVGELFTRWSEGARAILMSSEVEAHRQPFHPHMKKGHVTNLTATLSSDHGSNLCKVDWGLPLEMSALGVPGPLAIARSLIPCACRPDILRSHT